jgi:ribonuclease P protein component
MIDSPDKIPAKPRFSLKKEERLCSRIQIEKLFSAGASFLVYPLKVVYSEINFPEPFPAKAAFAVSKKLFKKAVRRNLIKRRMREAYRLNKHLLNSEKLSSQNAIMFIYVSKEILDFHSIEKAMKKSLQLISKKSIQNP